MGGERRLDLDRARGFAIVLVVFGHLMGRGRPEGMDWYEAAFVGLYTFHMPFFLYLAGVTAQLAGIVELPAARWPGLIRRRARRLLLPFVLMGVLIVAGKYLSQPLLHVDAAPSGLLQGLCDAFWHTANSPVIMIWFLWVLFFLTLGALPLLCLPRAAGAWRAAPVLAVGLGLFLTGLPEVMYLNKLADHAVFFALGLIAGLLGARATAAIDRAWPVALVVLLALSGATALGLIDRRWALLAAGLPAIPALHGLVRRLDRGEVGRALLFLGRFSMVIYLFNTIAIGLTKAVLLKLGLAWTAEGATLAVPLLLAAGIAGPVLLKRLILRHLPALDRLTD